MNSMNGFGLLRAVVIICILCTLASDSNGMECSSKSFISILGPSSCPEYPSSDKSFCCEKDSGFVYCCDIDEFAKTKGVEYLIPVISGILVGIVAGCFICCLCCPCCMLYKRRNRGTVYGRVQQPAAVVTVQTQGPTPSMMPPQGNMPNTMPMPMPMQMPQPQSGAVGITPPAPYPAAYPVPAGNYSGQPSMPPPPYSAVMTNEGYVKQAPYNPNFVNN